MTAWTSKLRFAAVAVMVGILFCMGAAAAAAKAPRNETTTASDDFWESDIFHLPAEGKATIRFSWTLS
jgi:hypothetical protein